LQAWHIVAIGVVVGVIVVLSVVLAFVLSSGSDDARARADMEQRWEDLDRDDRLELCGLRETSEDLVVTMLVEVFQERAALEGEELEVSREVAEDFVRDKCGG
jgi:uncharacterized membrane-anchored protein YhcB (DUF1043 family)